MIALFVSLGGTAAALSGSNNVQSDDLGPGAQVKAPDVAANAVNGSDVVGNSITGTDVNESSLGIVPNADKLDGKDSTAFAPSGDFHSGYETVDDSVPGDGDPSTALLFSGPVDVYGLCWDNRSPSGDDLVHIGIDAAAGSSISAVVTDDGSTNHDFIPSASGQHSFGPLSGEPDASDVNEVEAADFVIVNPLTGQVVSVQASAHLNSPITGTDCAFGAVGYGFQPE